MFKKKEQTNNYAMIVQAKFPLNNWIPLSNLWFKIVAVDNGKLILKCEGVTGKLAKAQKKFEKQMLKNGVKFAPPVVVKEEKESTNVQSDTEKTQ